MVHIIFSLHLLAPFKASNHFMGRIAKGKSCWMVGVKVCGIKTDLKNQEANDFSNGWFVFYFLHYYNYFLYFSHYINCLITCFLFLLFLFRYLLYTLLYKENVNINTICHLFSCCDVQVNPSCTCNKMENTVCMKDFTEW